MPLNFEDFTERLCLLCDVELLCEVLGITSEDIVERFADLVELHQETLRDAFDITLDTEEEDFESYE